ncbi:hypothetical protein COY32_00650 [candidate division WWE3 bacterium CG_4_10_14_0_2_um_filter_41_14]|uniref:Uncharacterized protein n=1 Tax=candidate division WWE3 bacterium CG_4_10_14_0_2_um_filter_41_14 TaxID=1975072 RepID=A0A2M7TLQ4_UNCKA|nr:MAG: hypothetical protein COY32_00650 [candidate division WWE3 bacterium CG_4_10_14_0_2_um_filter_41_14]
MVWLSQSIRAFQIQNPRPKGGKNMSNETKWLAAISAFLLGCWIGWEVAYLIIGFAVPTDTALLDVGIFDIAGMLSGKGLGEVFAPALGIIKTVHFAVIAIASTAFAGGAGLGILAGKYILQEF